MTDNAIPVREKHGFHVLQPVGALTVSVLVDFRKAIEKVMTSKQAFVAIDLTQVSKIDSSAIGLLRNVNLRISEKSGMLCIFGMKPELQEILKVTNLQSEFRVLKDEQEFDESFEI